MKWKAKRVWLLRVGLALRPIYEKSIYMILYLKQFRQRFASKGVSKMQVRSSSFFVYWKITCKFANQFQYYFQIEQNALISRPTPRIRYMRDAIGEYVCRNINMPVFPVVACL